MRQTRILMGMPITVEIADATASASVFEEVFVYFRYVDEKFSTYKPDSEISRINRGFLAPADFSADMRQVLRLAEETKQQTSGYFDIRNPQGLLDPSGLVKGWAIAAAARLLQEKGFLNYYIEAGGDIQLHGRNASGQPWRVGIRHPADLNKIVKVVYLEEEGMATSGTYLRGQHIYNPHAPGRPLNEIISLTVIAPDVYEADRFATAAVAMGRAGIVFLERQPALEAYMIDQNGTATFTSGFEKYLQDAC